MRKGILRAACSSIAAIILGAGLSLAASAAPAVVSTPADWLTRMVSAPATNSYEGFFIYENAGGLTSIRIFHSGVDGKEQERLVYQDGPYRELLRRGDQVAMVRPDGDVSRFSSDSTSPSVIERLGSYRDDLRRSYRLMFGGDDRVAGRNVLRVEVQPRDQHRYGYILWIDQETGVLLRSEMLGEKGAVLERFQYIHFEPARTISAKQLEPSRAVTWEAASKPAPKPAPKDEVSKAEVPKKEMLALWWETGWIPNGFDVTSQNTVDSPVSKQKADSILFSDGLASFSIFVEEDHSRVQGPASEQIGATSAVSRIFRKGDAYYNVTVIGEIPLGTAERIAVSVKAAEQVAESP
ncbi:MucB/RseB C-terminal domain-containing protein [Sansalvadorimonas sp. 2012CJ34-2]|uniref:MucB/RseB C-terminal domain-containing protein n=1 Tax=Parendozoicomonas callyspongiae TaxID=2942213 RepID=A0ABT0PG01_9GAMM|nr:MucB/RseB C-terminal domain-containing protein [Sansalvadorimonas sp. 2012CJ34-2]MCL6270186.1 MucB/RseB C-terminal domain-containing protein [Sansalvadorimonas sp. 2012CJ34-2]